MRRREIIRSIGSVTTGSIALAGSTSASGKMTHLDEITERANTKNSGYDKEETQDGNGNGENQDGENNGNGEGELNGKKPAAVGAEAPRSVKREVYKRESNGDITTSALKSDNASRDLPGTPCDELEVYTTMKGSFDSFWTYDGIQAKWESSGESDASTDGCGYQDNEKPDELTLSVTTKVNGVEMNVSAGAFGGGSTNGTNAASYTGTFENETDASHSYENFVVKSLVALYNAHQEASTTALFDTDAYSVHTRVSKQ